MRKILKAVENAKSQTKYKQSKSVIKDTQKKTSTENKAFQAIVTKNCPCTLGI